MLSARYVLLAAGLALDVPVMSVDWRSKVWELGMYPGERTAAGRALECVLEAMVLRSMLSAI